MGYSYGRDAAGNSGLACDGCGAIVGTRKRVCPYTVTGSSLRTPHGRRPAPLPYCPAPAYCPGCYAARGGLRGVHGESCRDGAASMQAADDAQELMLDAGELLVTSAVGSYPGSGIPEGMVSVTFSGRYDAATRNVPEVTRLVPAPDYDWRARPRLSDYPAALVPTVMRADKDNPDACFCDADPAGEAHYHPHELTA